MKLTPDLHDVFVLPAGDSKPGSGAMALEWDNNYLTFSRGDLDSTQVRCHKLPYSGKWHYYTLVWDDVRTAFYCDGEKMPYGRISDSWSALREVLAIPSELAFVRDPAAFTNVFFGNSPRGDRPFNGLLDDIRIWSEPMDAACVKPLFERMNGGPAPEYNRWDEPFDPALTPPPATNVLSIAPLPQGGVPGRLELLERIALDDPAVFADTNRFRKVGDVVRGELNGVPYLETVPGKKNTLETRFAVRLKLDGAAPLHVIEVDYPDDKARTMDIVVQRARRPPGVFLYPYILQVGVMGGDEYPLSGKMATSRLLYWTEDADTALIVRGLHDQAAAVAEIRVYRVAANALPAAHVNAPADPADRRHFALFFEDPALEKHFVVNQAAPGRLQDHLDRLIAYMKYFGQDMLCYPGVWYHGLICDKYMPRNHAPHFLKEFCRRFDREGLAFMPTVNLQTVPVAPGVITRKALGDGSLHNSVVSIHATGKPNPGGWHGSPPNYNIAHPDVQAYIRREIAAMLDECADHPSFHGVCLHLVRITCTWWGDIESGYNDYCIDAFEKATGVRVPVDRADPLRGKAYAAWLCANAYEKWVDWRCDVLTAFYRQIDADLKARRKDLRLWLIAQPETRLVANGGRDWKDPQLVTRLFREAGLDPVKLTAAIPDVMFGNMERYGWWRDEISGGAGCREAKERVRDMMYDPDCTAAMLKGGHPSFTLWDSYYETAVGRAQGVNRLSGGWLEETGWRVSVINPVGRNALRDFALALKFGDVLDFAKGGFLIGTYGTEEVVTPFMQAFRALPAVRFADAPCANENVRVRTARHGGKDWLYVLNVSPSPQEVDITFPAGMADLVTGTVQPTGVARLKLDAWDLRAFGK